jgi:hypothetical protein
MLLSASRFATGFAALLVLLSAAPLLAQDHGDHGDHHAHQVAGMPDGWMAHFDRAHAAGGDHAHHAAAEGLSFVEMAPGWHVTTGPSGIFYHHDFRAEGSFAVETEIHLFDPEERRESFGLFVGGSALHDAEAQRYTYFLVRRDGRFLIRERDGEEVRDLVPWTAHEVIPTWDGRPEGSTTVPYTLAVRVEGSEVHFLVNGTRVHALPRAELALDGHYGLRVNHNLNLHVTRVDAVLREEAH